jgi:hypothetical protein
MSTVTTASTVNSIMTKESWEGFVKGDLLNYLVKNNCQKITIEDGAGKKGVIKVNSKGDYQVQITSKETM